MATYVNNLRLKEITTGDEDGTWGTSTNTNLELIGEALGYNTQDCFATDANATTTVADGATDPARALYFKVTSSATLTATRTLTVAPSTVSRVMFIENATTGSQSIEISQGSGANVTIPTGEVKIVYLDGAGAGAAVVDALSAVAFDLTSQVTGTLPVANGGTGITSFGTGVGTALGNNTNATGGVVTVDGTATLTSKTLTDPAIVGTVLEDVYTISDGAAFEIDPGNGSIQLITLGASRTPKATNFAAGEAVTLMVDDGTAYTLTWTDATFGGSGVVWFTDAGSAPTLNTSGYTSISLWKVGSQVYGARVGDA